MGRPLRRQTPGQYYLVTTRCHQARFFLRPDRELNDAVLEWLTRAQLQFPKLGILAVCVMSNHLHLVVRDESGELAAWAGYFLGNLARAVNRLRKRDGPCFQRRYSAEPILDDQALLDRIVYTVTNPVKAGLCPRVSDWPGIALFATEGAPLVIPVSWLDKDRERQMRARVRRKGALPQGDEFRVGASLVINRLPPESDGDTDSLRVAIEAREKELAERRRDAGVRSLGAIRVLAQNWHAAPRNPKRSVRPTCHAASPAIRKAFRENFKDFVSVFRQASELLRLRAPQISFPEWSFPPGSPLEVPALAGSG